MWARMARNTSLYPFPSDGFYLHETMVKASLEKVWAFFSYPKNVKELTPISYQMEILEGDREAKVTSGASVVYRTNVLGVPQRWPAYFPYVWEEPNTAGFVDIRCQGLFRRWCHIHTFERRAEGTRIIDEIRWELAFPTPTKLLTKPVVLSQIRQLFAYREKRMDQLFTLARRA
jgi:ligand-binding SRPBCC domain-containing protein